MRIFLATATLDDVLWAAEQGLADGVATSPGLLAAAVEEGDGRELIAEISRVTGLPISVSVAAVSAADIYRDGRELAKLADNVIVQVPLVEDGVGAMRKLSNEGVRVAATLVFNAAQALLAAKAGASMVVTPLDQLDAHGLNSITVVEEIRAVFDADDVECDVMAATPANAAQFAGCALAGANMVSVTPDVLRALLLHPLTDRGVDRFLNDLARRPKTRTGG